MDIPRRVHQVLPRCLTVREPWFKFVYIYLGGRLEVWKESSSWNLILHCFIKIRVWANSGVWWQMAMCKGKKLLPLPRGSVQERKGLGSPCEAHCWCLHQASSAYYFTALFQAVPALQSECNLFWIALQWWGLCWFLLKDTSSKMGVCHLTHVAQRHLSLHGFWVSTAWISCPQGALSPSTSVICNSEYQWDWIVLYSGWKQEPEWRGFKDFSFVLFLSFDLAHNW